ncbi:MAG TPA: ABC transporter permease [Verrucomicrobiae bacterium]|nr:ABC transporter permease [Verrucomicrobiae bacterium]
MLPVAAREVREASRQSRTYAWRWITAAVALAFIAFISWMTRYSSSQGHELFVAISVLAYIYCLLAGAVRTADTIAQEKRDNTLGLLFLTDLKGWDIILGKLLSSSVNCIFGLLAMVPMLAIPMMMGGVPWGEFMRAILALFTALFLSISWGFLISALFRQSVVTISAALGVIILLGAGIPMLFLLLTEEFHLRELAQCIFVFSPTHCMIFASDVNGADPDNHYWIALGLNNALALANLRLAIFFLPRFWQEVPKNKKTETWRNRMRALRFGKPNAKKRLRTRLLNHNPFFWLANREQVSSAGLMAVAVVILIGGLVMGLAWASKNVRGTDEMMIGWVVGLALVHALIAFRMAMSASYRLAEDRRSGALELLLGTEVSIKELLRGYWMALGRQFFGPIMIVIFAGVFGVAMVLLLFAENVRVGNIFDTAVEIVERVFTRGADKEAGYVFFIIISIQVMLALNWIALIWVGMWLGLREKRSGFATWVTLALVFGPPWFLLIAGIVTFIEMGFGRGIQPDEAFSAVLISGWVLGLSHVVALSWWARGNLIERFREAAADRYTGPRRIAWPKIRRVAIRFAAVGVCLVLVLHGLRDVIDYRGNKAWTQAVAAYPNFKLDAQPERAHVPDNKNLAQAPFFLILTSAGPNPKAITWNLSSPNRGGWGESLEWGWSTRRRMNLARIEDIYIERKILKERRETPALTTLAALSDYDSRLDDLRADAAARPLLQYTAWTPNQQPAPNIRAGFQTFHPQLADLRSQIRELIQTLALRASAGIANGETDISDLFLALRLAEGLKELPHSAIQYNEMILHCVQPIYDGLASRVWKNDDLKKIQDVFGKLDLWDGFDAFREEYLRQIINDSEQVIATRRGIGRSRESWLAQQAPIGLRRKWEAETLHWGLTTLPKIVDTKTRRIDAVGFRQIPQTRPAPGHPRRYSDQITMSIRSLGFTQTTIDQVIAVCALERYRNDKGKLPEKLDELVPNYLSAVPHDVFTGQPLHYVRSSDLKDFTIYSVGPDGADNKASPAAMSGPWMLWQEQNGTDWVWNSAASDPPPPKKKNKSK